MTIAGLANINIMRYLMCTRNDITSNKPESLAGFTLLGTDFGCPFVACLQGSINHIVPSSLRELRGIPIVAVPKNYGVGDKARSTLNDHKCIYIHSSQR